MVEIDNDFFITKLPYPDVEEMVGTPNIKYMDKDNFKIIGIAVLMFLTIVISVAAYITIAIHTKGISAKFWVSTGVLLFNISIHEASHALFLRAYGEKVSKIGFTFIFIFPAIYVRTTKSYLLSKYRRINVYLAGLFSNSIFLLIGILVFSATGNNVILGSLDLVVVTIISNCIPIIKTDIYYVINALYSRHQLQKNKKWYDTFIRGAIMFALLWVLKHFIMV